MFYHILHLITILLYVCKMLMSIMRNLNQSLNHFANICSIDLDKFCSDIDNSTIITAQPDDLHVLAELYNSTLSNLLDKHAPLITKSITQSNPWYTADLKQVKAVCRTAERKWRQTHYSV